MPYAKIYSQAADALGCWAPTNMSAAWHYVDKKPSCR